MTRGPLLPLLETAVLFDRRHRGQDAPPAALWRSRLDTLNTGEGVVTTPSCIDQRRVASSSIRCLFQSCIAAAIQTDDERRLPLVVGLFTVALLHDSA